MRAATAVVTSGAFRRRFHPEMSFLEGMGGPDTLARNCAED